MNILKRLKKSKDPLNLLIVEMVKEGKLTLHGHKQHEKKEGAVW